MTTELDNQDTYALEKGAYIEGKAAHAVGVPSSANPHNGRMGEMWSMGWNYDNHVSKR